MGYNTTIVVLNDALEDISNDHTFGRKLSEAIREQPLRRGERIDITAGCHGNAAHVVESHHADQTAIITVGGNLGICQHTSYGWRHNETATQIELCQKWAKALGFELVPVVPAKTPTVA